MIGSPVRFEELELLWILVELRKGVHPRRLIIVERRRPRLREIERPQQVGLAAQDKMPATGRAH